MELGKDGNMVGEKDGVIIVDHGSSRRESNLMLSNTAELSLCYVVGVKHLLELAEPTIKDAFVRIGPLYLISGFGGSLLSCLHLLVLTDKANVVSVGASGALFGLLGAMLSELITNWTIYTNKCSALTMLIAIIALNLAIGFIPGVDNSAHIGGFLSGFLLGFILLIRPQYGYVSHKYLPLGYDKDKRKSKHKCYQYFFCAIALIVFALGYTNGLLKLLKPATFEKINDRLMEKLQHVSKVNY
ncbi:RHOMBOID-like protein [Drosera capensis]